MSLSLQQVHKQTQQLIMTPQMQQSIQLLQMNSMELDQLTQNELEENPFLQLDEDREEEGRETAANPDGDPPDAALSNSSDAEREDGGFSASEGASTNGDSPDSDFLAEVDRDFGGEIPSEAVSEQPEFEPSSNGGEPSEGDTSGMEIVEPTADLSDLSMEQHPEQFDQVDMSWEEYYDGAENASQTREPEEEERDFTEYTAARVSLYEHLMDQLRLCSLEGRDAEAGEYLIGCIDENGFLNPDCIQEVMKRFEMTEAETEHVLEVLQEFDPTGVAARNRVECLLIQMKALGSYSETARRVLTDHLEELQRKKFKPIARALGTDEETIAAIHQKVSRLEPRPGRAFTTDSAHYIEPDVVVKLIDGQVSIYMNEGRSNRLSVNKFYRRMLALQAKALTKEDRAYAMDKYRNALMLIKNIEKRKSTILRVTEAIMNVQREFLEKGVEALKPLTLREIADEVGMHESTVARVTSKKYVETPQGLFQLKYFFSSGIGATSGSGDAVSSRSIKSKLADLVADENPKRPLSDQKLAEIFNNEGFNIARRTVAKYREQLKILPAKLRRKN